MNIEKELSKILKNIEGRILLIGNDSNSLNKIVLDNNNILSCDIFNANISKGNAKSKGSLGSNNTKQIALRKIDKEYKKKELDYIFCDIEVVKNEINYFIKNSLYLSKNRIFIYGNINDYDLETLIERYKKYNLEMNLKEKNDTYILEIYSSSKYKKIKTKLNLVLYNTVDSINKLTNFIGDLMTR